MKRFFDLDNPLFKIMTMLMQLAEINVLFLLFSLPVVTIGASYTAMMTCTLDLEQNEGRFSLFVFIRTFRRILLPSIVIWLAGAAAEGLIFYNILFWAGNFSGVMRIVLCGFYAVLMVVVAGVMQFLFAFLARTEKWQRFYLKNSILLAIAKFPIVLIMLILTASPLTVLLMTGSVLLRMLPLILLFWFACPAFACSILLVKILKPLFPELFPDIRQL